MWPFIVKENYGGEKETMEVEIRRSLDMFYVLIRHTDGGGSGIWASGGPREAGLVLKGRKELTGKRNLNKGMV